MNITKDIDISLYSDYHEGALVYITEDGRGIIEQNGDRLIVKIYQTEFEQWNKLATLLLADVKEMQRWALAKDGWKGQKINPMFVDSIYENEKYAANDDRQRKQHADDDKRDYRLLQAWKRSEDGWRIYENDDEYLFMWQGNSQSYDDFADEILDSAWQPIRFLRAWYDRVNGLK